MSWETAIRARARSKVSPSSENIVAPRPVTPTSWPPPFFAATLIGIGAAGDLVTAVQFWPPFVVFTTCGRLEPVVCVVQPVVS